MASLLWVRGLTKTLREKANRNALIVSDEASVSNRLTKTLREKANRNRMRGLVDENPHGLLTKTLREKANRNVSTAAILGRSR